MFTSPCWKLFWQFPSEISAETCIRCVKYFPSACLNFPPKSVQELHKAWVYLWVWCHYVSFNGSSLFIFSPLILFYSIDCLLLILAFLVCYFTLCKALWLWTCSRYKWLIKYWTRATYPSHCLRFHPFYLKFWFFQQCLVIFFLYTYSNLLPKPLYVPHWHSQAISLSSHLHLYTAFTNIACFKAALKWRLQ